jgi:N-methylhydantoinase A
MTGMAAASRAQGRYFCGVDIGGTFTDCVIRDADGQLTIAKSLSTPDDPSRGFLEALAAAAQKLEISLEELLGQSELVLHGTTLGTNALLEMKGAKAGLITTQGHADALIIMRSVGRSAGLPVDRLLHVSRHRKPEPLIPRRLIREVSERVDWSGDVVLPLNESEARSAIRELLEADVEAIGVCFLWGFLNPHHEIAVREMIREMAPEVYVTCAHELITQPGEYERSAATAINCFIGPLMTRYLGRVQERTRELGYARPLLIMQSSGGVGSVEEVARRPLFTIGSGPAGGLAGCQFLADLLGHENVIASDVGGTSFDVGLISEGQPLGTTESTVNQYTFRASRLEVVSIGSGGGSIIRVDPHSETLKVGPESAGSDPGPACYGRGGERPTVTDANLLLGTLAPESFLAGQLWLDLEAARAAMQGVSSELGMDALEAASGAVQIVEFQMAELMRQMTVQRGLDPRDFIVYAYGGAAGAHAATFARELGCRTVVVPLGSTASAWSAFGVQSADLLQLHEKSELCCAPFDAEQLNEIFEELERRGREQLLSGGVDEKNIVTERSAEMKFRLQIHSVEVPVPAGRLTRSDMESLEHTFVEKYERLHGEGSAFTDAGTDISLLRVANRGRILRPSIHEWRKGTGEGHAGEREVYWRKLGRHIMTPLFDWSQMGSGDVAEGPAIVQMPETSIVVPPDTVGRVDTFGNFVMTLSE